MTAHGEELGFEFNFVDGFRMHNTFNTHQLLHWADTQDRKHDLKQALFTAHFTNGRDLSDDAVLVDIAVEIGLDRAEAAVVLADQRFAAEVREEQKFWTGQGISGVPAMVFDRQHLVTGAQGVDNYQNILNQLQEMHA
jgi:predicted DsbA family dithiol-disulfide isomerase